MIPTWLKMEPSDKELLLACRRGEEFAWEALIRRYQRLMYAIPKRAGLDEDQAAEVFQEVFTTLFQKLNDIDEPERLHAWLVTTARRKTWRLISKEQSHSGSADEAGDKDELAMIPDNLPLADEVLLHLEKQHRVRTILAGLDERCRKLITMLFYEADPPSYAEIAMSLGTSEGSIGPTRARCLEKMLRSINKDPLFAQ
jgi:RNA polymerase sigma factor (sigma-70 family)